LESCVTNQKKAEAPFFYFHKSAGNSPASCNFFKESITKGRSSV
jgi:hypothetical protein